jgi:hypothetical protein
VDIIRNRLPCQTAGSSGVPTHSALTCPTPCHHHTSCGHDTCHKTHKSTSASSRPGRSPRRRTRQRIEREATSSSSEASEQDEASKSGTPSQGAVAMAPAVVLPAGSGARSGAHSGTHTVWYLSRTLCTRYDNTALKTVDSHSRRDSTLKLYPVTPRPSTTPDSWAVAERHRANICSEVAWAVYESHESHGGIPGTAARGTGTASTSRSHRPAAAPRQGTSIRFQQMFNAHRCKL